MDTEGFVPPAGEAIQKRASLEGISKGLQKMDMKDDAGAGSQGLWNTRRVPPGT